jgi:predicted NAD/FAD-binding protein
VTRQRVAVVGGGIAGLATAWLLEDDHDVTLFEREPHPGGHAHTVAVPCDGATVHAETGFKFFMDTSHDLVLSLMDLLGLRRELRRSTMTIVDRIRDVVLVLPPRSPRHLARLAARPGCVRDLLGLRRLIASGDQVVPRQDWSQTLAAHAAALGLSERFTRELLLPLCASSWGAPLELMATFPAYDVLKNMWKGGRGFYELPEGNSSYIRALVAAMPRVALRLGQAVDRLLPAAGAGITVEAGGRRESFDQVVMAVPAWTAAALLEGLPGAAPAAATLRELRWFDTGIFIHGDASFMPAARGDWSVINHVFEPGHYRMTEWSGHHARRPVFRSWVRAGSPEPIQVHTRKQFRHLVVTAGHPDLQRRLAGLQGTAGIWLAGMYTTDVDDHESALLSAVRVAEALAPRSPALSRLRAAHERRRTGT